jgi:membrane protein YqaA with SNARE-associated domain
MSLPTSFDFRARGAVASWGGSPIRLLYQRLLRLPIGPQATAALAAVALLDACIVPVPAELLLVPLIVNRPKSAWGLAAVASAASVLGAMIGYGLGRLCYGMIEIDIVAFNGPGHWLDAFQRIFARWGMVIIILKGLTPIPLKLVSLASGIARYDVREFLLACTVARISHYFMLASILKYRCVPIALLLDRHLERVAMLILLFSGSATLWLLLV